MIVYIATNRLNGKVYVGQTIKTLKRRKTNHCISANTGSSSYFHRAVRKYGADNFEWEVIRICDSIESLNAFEQYYILYYNSMGGGYNLMSGGLNSRHTAESNEKNRQAHLGMRHTIETKKKISKNSAVLSGKDNYFYGRRLSINHKLKISKANRGENNAFWGKYHTEESIEKMRKANIGRKHSEETKLKIGKAQLGEKNHNYGKKVSKETRKKLSKALKEYYKKKKEVNNENNKS